MVELIAVAIGAVLAGLGILLKQRSNARERADAAEREKEQVTAAREQEQRISTAKEKAREEASNVQREADERPATERPSGTFRR